MRVPPIPLSALLHTAEYHEYTGDERWGPGYKAPVTLKNIRIQPTKEKGSKALLFFDCTNSSPVVGFVEKSKVVFGQAEFSVSKATPQYALEPTPHHIEVQLI